MADLMPVRKSTNQVEGINRCECGQVRTIHRARGKRAKFLYSICDDCGTNQQTGAFWQSRFKLNFPTVETLTESEITPDSAVIEPKTVTEPKPQQTIPEGESNTDQTEQEPHKQVSESTIGDDVTNEKAISWRVIITGIVLGGLTGGLITRL